MNIDRRLSLLESEASRQPRREIGDLSDQELTDIITDDDGTDVSALSDEDLRRIISGETWPLKEKQ